MPPVHDVHDTLQDLSEALGRRLIVLDERLRVVAYSIHESDADRARLSFVLAHSDTWSVPAQGAELDITDVDGLGRRVLVPLRDHRHRVGFLLVMLDATERELPSATRRVLDDAVSDLGIRLSLAAMYSERDREDAHRLLEELVGPEGAARVHAASSLLRQGLVGSSKQYSTVALGTSPHGPAPSTDTTSLAVGAILEFVARSSTASVVGTTLATGLGILVFPRPVVGARLRRLLTNRPDFSHVRAGVGPLVPNLESAHTSFDRARLALELACAPGSPEKVVLWDEAGIDRLLVMLPLDRITVNDLPAPVGRLISHRSVSSDLVTTLDAYLAHGGDAKATAASLHIHRSTLYYRLDRLREVLDCDLADGVTRRDLHTGLRIAQLAGLI